MGLLDIIGSALGAIEAPYFPFCALISGRGITYEETKTDLESLAQNDLPILSQGHDEETTFQSVPPELLHIFSFLALKPYIILTRRMQKLAAPSPVG